MTRKELITEARTYVGTPYLHLGRLKGAGVDCAGVVEGLLTFSGIPHKDFRGYTPLGEGVSLADELKKYLEPVYTHLAKPGDVLIFWVSRPGIARHCAISTEFGMLHTHSRIGKVAEHGIDSGWKKRIMGAFRFPLIED